MSEGELSGRRATVPMGGSAARAGVAAWTLALVMAAAGGLLPAAAQAAGTPPEPRATATATKPLAKETRAAVRKQTSVTDEAKKAPKSAGDKVVYLTFDDGPHRTYTEQILWLLDKYDADATFFMVGAEAKANPEVLREVRRSRHSIGNHTYSHPWLTEVTSAEVRRQLRSTDELLGRTRCMRPPGGFLNDRVRTAIGREGKSIAMWHVDTRDWTRPGAAAISRTALDRVRPGSVILMHDGGGDRSQTSARPSRCSAPGKPTDTVSRHCPRAVGDGKGAERHVSR